MIRYARLTKSTVFYGPEALYGPGYLDENVRAGTIVVYEEGRTAVHPMDRDDLYCYMTPELAQHLQWLHPLAVLALQADV